MDDLLPTHTQCSDCLAHMCDGCGVVFRDGREQGLVKHSVYDAEADAYLMELYCPACDAQCHEGAA